MQQEQTIVVYIQKYQLQGPKLILMRWNPLNMENQALYSQNEVLTGGFLHFKLILSVMFSVITI